MAEVVERVANLEARFDAQAQQLNDIRQFLVRLEDKIERRFEAVDVRFSDVDRRLTALEGRFGTLERRFEALETRVDGLERRMESGFAELRDEMRAHFRWMMGAVVGAALTVIVTILGAAL